MGSKTKIIPETRPVMILSISLLIFYNMVCLSKKIGFEVRDIYAKGYQLLSRVEKHSLFPVCWFHLEQIWVFCSLCHYLGSHSGCRSRSGKVWRSGNGYISTCVVGSITGIVIFVQILNLKVVFHGFLNFCYFRRCKLMAPRWLVTTLPRHTLN